MTAPNIDMIASSLLNCSLNYQNTAPSSTTSSSSSSAVPPPPPPPLAGISDGSITVELNSNIALPFQWEQCLDIRTGQVYYINWEDGSRTDTDPRSANFSLSSSDQDSDSDQEIQFNCNNNACNSSSDQDSSSSSSINLSSAVSSFSPTESSSSSTGTGTTYGTDTGMVLVAAGCKSCFMYFMIPKFVDVCPKCGGDGLLHLDRA
ncbi:hypothetical protein LUZ60_004865 [Juncus effusus]|nr:hypothetical protein LUZ60_004865 [Juncus effusus]